MNIELYKEMLSIRSLSYSTEQDRFRKWIIDYLYAKQYKNLSITTDTYGNLYVQKGHTKTYNCVVAHLDINQKACADFSVILNDHWITGINNNTGRQIGLGHDDKIGVYFAFQMLERFDNIKCFFPLDEEVGCVGTEKSDDSFFKNVGFMVQLDRRGYADISQSTNGIEVVTQNTKTKLMPLLREYGFHWEDCMFTDVGELVRMNCKQGVNISCGYYNEHSDSEILNIDQYLNSEEFAYKLLQEMDGTIYNIQPVSTWGSYGYYGRSKYSSTGARTFSDGWEDPDYYGEAYGYKDDFYDDYDDSHYKKKEDGGAKADRDVPEISANNYEAIKNYYYEATARLCNDINLSDSDVLKQLKKLKDDVVEIEAILLMDLTCLTEYLDDRIEKFEAFVENL